MKEIDPKFAMSLHITVSIVTEFYYHFSKPVVKKLPASQPSLFKWMTRSPQKKHDASNGSDSGVPPAKKEKQ